MKNSQKLKKLEVGDSIIFQKGEEPFVVKATNYRYALACNSDGTEYTIVDKKDEVLASTTQLFEEFANFNINENAQKILDMLHTGERELSKKYRDTFAEFDRYAELVGSKVIFGANAEN